MSYLKYFNAQRLFILDKKELRKGMITIFNYLRECHGYDCNEEITK